jgi:hypothetical protein
MSCRAGAFVCVQGVVGHDIKPFITEHFTDSSVEKRPVHLRPQDDCDTVSCPETIYLIPEQIRRVCDVYAEEPSMGETPKKRQ